MDAGLLTEKARKELPGSTAFADDVVMCGANEVDMTAYLESTIKTLEETGMRVSRPRTQWMIEGSCKRKGRHF